MRRVLLYFKISYHTIILVYFFNDLKYLPYTIILNYYIHGWDLNLLTSRSDIRWRRGQGFGELPGLSGSILTRRSSKQVN